MRAVRLGQTNPQVAAARSTRSSRAPYPFAGPRGRWCQATTPDRPGSPAAVAPVSVEAKQQ
jgi:hypothetical protein